MSIVAMIVDRFHVSLSDTEVRRKVNRKLQKSVDPETRERILVEALARHHENQDFVRRWRF